MQPYMTLHELAGTISATGSLVNYVTSGLEYWPGDHTTCSMHHSSAKKALLEMSRRRLPRQMTSGAVCSFL